MKPPRVAALLLARLVRRDISEYLAGDLEEAFARRAAEHGGSAARRWYWIEVIRAIAAVPRQPAASGAPRVPHPDRDSRLRSFAGDLRYGARALMRSPAYALVAVSTLALAVGANTAIFSFANLLLIRPLPLNRPERLAFVFSIDPHSAPRGKVSFPDYEAFRDRSSAFEGLAAWTDVNVTLSGRGAARRLLAREVTPNLFSVWGLTPVAGRLLRPDEDVAGDACPVVLSHRLWAMLFHRDPAAVSRQLTLDGRACTIVGVVTPAIEVGNMSLIDVWMATDAPMRADRRDNRIFAVAGRLRPGISVDQAGAGLRTIAQQLQREFPVTNAGWTTRTQPTRDAMLGEHTWLIVSLLMLVVGFVLLIACANIANLLLARASGRRRELAVRVALGATRGAIVRQLVAESLLLGVGGGLLGIAIAEAGLKAIRAAAYEPFFALVVMDWNVLAFAAAVSLAAPLVFAVLPAYHAAASTYAAGLREGVRGGAGPAGRRVRNALVVSQVGLAIVLLVVAGLTVRSMITLTTVEFGIDPKTVLTARIEVPPAKYASDAAVAELYDGVCRRLTGVPGLSACAVASGIPVLTPGPRLQFDVDRRLSAPGDRPWAQRFAATPGYLGATGGRVLRGRWFTASDAASAPPVVVVNLEAASRYFRSVDDAIGRRLTLGDPADGASAEVVGVVANTTNQDLETSASPQIFRPVAQQPPRGAVLIARAAPGVDLAERVRAAVAEADPDVPVFQLQTVQTALDIGSSSGRILTALFVAFAALALVLATAGLHAVISFTVAQRTQEIGVRLALGATPGDIMRMVFRDGLGLVAAGTAVGLAGGAAAGRGMSSALFGVTPFDPATYGVTVAVVVAAAVAAVWGPARRAIRLDPIRTLKAE